MSQFCRQCGSNIPDASIFCSYCGARTELPQPSGHPVNPTLPFNNLQTTYDQPSAFSHLAGRQPSKNAKRQTAGIIAIIASGLTVILLFELVIGPMISGRTIFGGHSNMVPSTGSAVVSPDNPIVKIGDVTVDFGDNLTEETELRIQTGTQTPDSELYTGIDVYDFALEGQSEFATLVDITLPNTAGADEAFQVASYNEETAEWDNIPFEIAGNEVMFSTLHFSRYGLIKYHRDRYAGPLTPLVVNYDELRKALEGIEEDDLFERFLEEKGQIGSNEFVSKALAVTNDAIGYTSIPASYEAMVARVGDTAARELSDKLTLVGGIVTCLKIAYQWQAQDSYDKILQDNIFDLCELALAGAALAIPSSTLLPVAAVGVFALGIGFDYVFVPAYQDDSLQYTYRAYNDYCMYPHIAYDKNRAKALAEGTSEDSPWVVLQNYNAKKKKWESAHTGVDLLMLNQSFSQKWEKALMDIYTQYMKDPKAMQERIDTLIDEYLNVFWTLDGGDETWILDGQQQIQFAKDYCGITEEDWRWPDETEIQQMKNAMKAELMRELKPVFKDVQETVVEDMKKTLLQETDALVAYLNTEISFVIIDSEAEKEGFENTRVADDIIRIEPVSGAHQNDWVCQPGRYGRDTIFACTLNNYLKEGCPNKICFYKTEADLKAGNPYMTMDLRVEMPVTTIVLGQEQGIPGTYTNTWDRAIGLFPNTWALQQCLLTQFKDITVAEDGRISCRAPAQDATFMGIFGIDEEFEVNGSFGEAEMSGQIDLKTGTGRVHITGSMDAHCQLTNATATWTASFSGDMSVSYVNGGLILTSNRDNLSVRLTGKDMTENSDGSDPAIFDTDIQLNEQFVYNKAQ